MLAYAASRPTPVERRSHPNALLAIVAIHIAVIAAVMSAKMDLPARILGGKTIVTFVPIPKTPAENPPPSHDTKQPIRNNVIDQPDTHVTLPPSGPPQGIDTGKGPTGPIEIAGNGTGTIPSFPPPHSIVRIGAELATPAAQIRPPYPPSKIAEGEEATLRLRLTIDEHGRVTAVDPVGNVDRAFLEAARRHLIRYWRYRPATEDGQAVATSTVITLRFQLDG
jgi:protein TonB